MKPTLFQISVLITFFLNSLLLGNVCNRTLDKVVGADPDERVAAIVELKQTAQNGLAPHELKAVAVSSSNKQEAIVKVKGEEGTFDFELGKGKKVTIDPSNPKSIEAAYRQINNSIVQKNPQQVSRASGRTGATLIEVVTATAIISILLAMLAGAVQKARSSADRLSCMNNMKQLTLALNHHRESFGFFPQAYNQQKPVSPNETHPTDPSYDGMKWSTRILPFIEHDDIFKKTDADVYYPSAVKGHVRDNVKMFHCPSDPRGSDFQATMGPANLGAATHYLAVTGSVMGYGLTTDPNLSLQGLYPNSGPTVGMMYGGSRVKTAPDGESSTLLLGERPPIKSGQWGWRAWGAYDSSLGAVSVPTGNVLASGCTLPSEFSKGSIADDCSVHHFWSHHTGGGNFSFADGSVRFIQYNAKKVIPALSTRDGGEVTDGMDD